jgi:hypothetical protein
MSVSFDAEWRRSYVAQLRALVRRKGADEVELLPLADTVAALGRDGEEHEGTRDVPLDAIVGSVARVGDFDRCFRPRGSHLRERWESVAQVERDLPAIRLTRIGDLYFVDDGHHRVSVARARGMTEVRAVVHRIFTVVCARRHLTVTDLPAKAAERLFLERVPLPTDIRLGLRLDDPTAWCRLADAAEAWGFRQRLAGRPVDSRPELARSWWTDEVVPVIEELRGRGVCVSGDDLALYARALDRPA